jgi:arylsulfatase A-like enzyme
MTKPNILLIMTDEERYPPPYETDAVKKFREEQLPARESIRDGSLEFHRHYAGSTACLPSRATLFTGQYPSLHGASQTDAMAKKVDDPGMFFLDPDSVPTLGDWFRAGGYESHWRGKWHISYADLIIPGTHEGLMASDENGNPIPDAVAAYKRANRLDPYGFSGWIGREPHGAAKADCGQVKDGVFAEQVVDLFKDIAANRNQGPWLAVASFVNPHDITFNGWAWDNILKAQPPDDTVPDIPEPPSQADSFAGRPACQEMWKKTWIEMTYEQSPDQTYRRLYYYLHKLVDQAIGRVLESLHDNGLDDDTIVIFTSDHGDLLGSHGGMMQKWYNAYDESTHVPLYVKGPGIKATPGGVTVPTSHVDLIPTLMGLAGIDPEKAADGVAKHHDEAQPLPGRDLSSVITGSASGESISAPIYFMTEDEFSRGISETNMFSGKHYDAVGYPAKIESVISSLPTGEDGSEELWKLNHYYERLDDWNTDHGIPKNPFAGPPADPFFELHNLTLDPEERQNRATSDAPALSKMQSVLESQRDAKRLLPSLRNTAG